MNLGASLNSIAIFCFVLFKLVPTSFAFIYSIVFSVFVQLLSYILLFGTPWTAARQASLSFIISQRLLKLMSFESMMSSNHLNLCSLLLLPSIFPSTRVFFPVSQLFSSGGPSIGVSALVLPMNIQGWCPLGLTGLISLLSKGLSRVFSTKPICHNSEPVL